MDIKEVLLTKSVDILESAPILFDNIGYKFRDEENGLNYTLHFIQKEKSKYIVCALTGYLSDDNFTSSLEAFDNISYPFSLQFYKEFENMEEAKEFYEDVLKKCPTTVDLKSIIDGNCEIYGFDERKSVREDFHLGIIKEDESFTKEFIRHGYQRIFIRMFRFKGKIVINKNLQLVFDSEEEAKKAFATIKKHFSKCKMTKYKCSNEEVAFNSLLEKLVKKASKGSEQEIKVSRDSLKRITELKVNFEHKGIDYSISYSLTTRNGYYHGYQIKASIYKEFGEDFEDSSYDSYNYVHSFKRDIQNIVKTK